MIFFSCFLLSFPALWYMLGNHKLHSQPGPIVWNEGQIKSLITTHHFESNCCSEVWWKYGAALENMWKKWEISKYACTWLWLLNASLLALRSQHTRRPSSRFPLQLTRARGSWSNPPIEKGSSQSWNHQDRGDPHTKTTGSVMHGISIALQFSLSLCVTLCSLYSSDTSTHG